MQNARRRGIVSRQEENRRNNITKDRNGVRLDKCMHMRRRLHQRYRTRQANKITLTL